jgi:prostaglandin-endoperoxide synthase 2
MFSSRNFSNQFEQMLATYFHYPKRKEATTMSLLRKVKKLIDTIPVIGKPMNQGIDMVIWVGWRTPILGKFVNRMIINSLSTLTTPRPRPFSLWHHQALASNTTANGPVSDYTSWYSLTNKKFYSRHMPPLRTNKELPGIPQLLDLFKRPQNSTMITDRNSLLFMFYAQWLTDSVLRTNMKDRRRNTSNHEVDLCQIYGLTEEVTTKLRAPNSGKLKSRLIGGEEYPDLLYTTDAQGNLVVKPEYDCEELKDFIAAQDTFLNRIPNGTERKKYLYITGLENGNSSIGYTAFTTLFLRQHNKICDALVETYQNNSEWHSVDPDYFNERIFQTARLINIAIMLKLTLEEYINHISGRANFTLDCNFAENNPWYRPNWIAVEFNLLYRWHSMVPETITLGSNPPTWDYRFNNALFEQQGLDNVISALSSQAAGKICLQNTSEFLWQAEQASLQMARDFRLSSYNDYRTQFQLNRLKNFSELTSDKALVARLEEIYNGDINALEFLPGLFSQEPASGKLFGDLLANMISYDALTQIFTNPLLSKNILTAETLSEKGMEILQSISSFHDLAKVNSDNGQVTATFSVSAATITSAQHPQHSTPTQPLPLSSPIEDATTLTQGENL